MSHETRERAHPHQQQRTQDDKPGKASRGVGQIEDDLRQPFMGKIEVAHDGLVRISRAGVLGSECEGIGIGKFVRLQDVLAGLEMPPSIAIGDLWRKPNEEQRGGQQD